MRLHAAGGTEVGEELCPGSKDGTGVVEEIVVVCGHRDSDNSASGGQAGVVQ